VPGKHHPPVAYGCSFSPCPGFQLFKVNLSPAPAAPATSHEPRHPRDPDIEKWPAIAWSHPHLAPPNGANTWLVGVHDFGGSAPTRDLSILQENNDENNDEDNASSVE